MTDKDRYYNIGDKEGHPTGRTIPEAVRPETRNIGHVDESLAKQLESSIARNSRMVSRLNTLVKEISPLSVDPEMEDFIEDLKKIINDQDPS